MTTYDYNPYKYVKYESNFFVLPDELYTEFMNIPRNSTNPRVDPYKYSVAMLTSTKRGIVISLTNYEFEHTVGYKRDWIAMIEAIDEGIRRFEIIIEERKKKKKKKKWWQL
jgi:hypothetical protein